MEITFCHKVAKILTKWTFSSLLKTLQILSYLHFLSSCCRFLTFITNRQPANDIMIIHSSCLLFGRCNGRLFGSGRRRWRQLCYRRAMGRVELVAAVASLNFYRGGLWGDGLQKERRYCTGCDRSDGTEFCCRAEYRRFGRARCSLTFSYIPLLLQLSYDRSWFY
jgi:hypothetical protein